MAAIQIGNAMSSGFPNFNINTLMPDLTDNADIQEALRVYHYGAPTGTNPTTQYDPTNTNPANLKQPSIAYALYSLQSQITTLQGVSGVPGSAYNAKGAILVGTGVSSYSALPLPSQSSANDGLVLTINYTGNSTGLSWTAPPVTATNTVTLTNKTLTSPTITTPTLTLRSGSVNTNTGDIVFSPGIAQIQFYNGSATKTLVDTDTTQTLTNKTFTNPTFNNPTVTQLYLSDSVVVFEGSVADAFETTLGVINPTVDRTINLPNVDGTVITTGNLSSITTVGTVTSGSFPAANLSGTSLPAGITGSSLTSVGTIVSGTFPAANISGTTLASNVVTSSLTTVGTLTSLAVTGAITGASLSTTGSVTATGNVIGHIAFNTTPTGAYTLVLADDGKVVEIPAAGIVTVPSNATAAFPIGTQITILQTTSGQITLAGATTPEVVTVNATPGLKLRAQWSSCTLIKRGTNIWVAMGDLTA
jgi:hypothetical protein